MDRWTKDRDKLTGIPESSVTDHFDPATLNLHGYERKVVEVDSTTFKNLKTSQDILAAVKKALPHGSGNQDWDIVRTDGESFARVETLRGQSGFAAPEPEQITKYGAGNCDENCELAFREAGAKIKDHPVLMVHASGGEDHTYVLIGDPRDPRYGKGAVILDPWPSVNTAHTIGQDKYGNPVVDQKSRHEPFDIKAMPPAMSSQEVAQVYGKPVSGNDILVEIRDEDNEEKFVWVTPTGTDPSTVYKVRNGPQQTFGVLPHDIVQRYATHWKN
jgi:hypothetical protein